jgi:oxygen-independent coproporphyrinogen-3 oxidase
LTLGLYVHIPYCLEKCPFCSFPSGPFSLDRAAGYVEALLRELRMALSLPALKGRRFSSLYVGGGTPTVLPAPLLLELLASMWDFPVWKEGAEVTVEAHPRTVTADLLRGLREVGVNRLSLGVQSFSEEVLRGLGRAHTAEEARAACRVARRAGFANWSLDLIYGIPGHSDLLWQQTLEEALRYRPDHLSLYALSLEEGTRLHRKHAQGTYPSLDEEGQRAQYLLAVDRLREAGYARYEIANFALPGCASSHNLLYWRRQEYVGLGAGAHSFLGGARWRNVSSPVRYIQAIREKGEAMEAWERPGHEEAQWERMLLGLRLGEGIDLCAWRAEFQKDLLEQRGPEIRRLSEGGLLQLREQRLVLTDEGVLVADEVMAALA